MKQGWETKKMFDVVDFQRGLTYSKNDEVDFSENIVLRSNNVDLKTSKLDFTELRYINPKIVIPENKKVTKGSLLICTANGSKSHLGKVALIDDDYNYAFGGFMGLIKPKKNLNSDFLFYLMTSDAYKKFIGALSDGANINNLKFGDLGNFEIPFPPLPEQQRIVAILDEAFTAIERAKANAEQNLKNAKELFESYLQNIFENKGKDWEEKRLEQILEIERGGSPRPIQKYLTDDSDGINWIKIGDTKGIDKYIYKTNQKIKPDGLKKSRLVHEGDFILSNSMSFGRPYIMKITGAIHDGWLVLRERDKNIIDKDYLYNILGSPFVFNQFDNLAAGSTVRNLNIGLVSSVSIPLPGIKEQKLIVEKLEAISFQTKKLEVIYKKKLEDLEELKKSILQKAFSGGL